MSRDWDEREHPRNPHTGEFVDKAGGWVYHIIFNRGILAVQEAEE